MEPVKDYMKLLEMLPQPAFAARDGHIIGWNSRAMLCHLQEGQAVSELLLSGQEEYAALEDGCLGLLLKLKGGKWTASVTRMGDIEIFQLASPGMPDEIKAMSLMASQIRRFLFIMSLSVKRAQEPEDMKAELKQEVVRVQRMLNNASNMARYLNGEAAPYLDSDGVAILRELLEESAALLEKSGLTLDYTLPNHPVFLSIDEESVRQALYNLIGNAARFSPKSGTVTCKVTVSDGYLRILVSDQGPGVAPHQLSGIFSRYAREPIMEDGRTKLGLGLPLVRAVAIAHGGTVLAESPKGSGLRVLMTLECKQGKILRSPPPIPVVLSQSDGIIMLSDALPTELYK